MYFYTPWHTPQGFESSGLLRAVIPFPVHLTPPRHQSHCWNLNRLERIGTDWRHKQSFGICECANQHQHCHRCHPCFVKGLSTSKNTASASRRIRLVRSTGSSLSEPKKASASGEPCARLADTGLRIKAESRGYKMYQNVTRAYKGYFPSSSLTCHWQTSGDTHDFQTFWVSLRVRETHLGRPKMPQCCQGCSDCHKQTTSATAQRSHVVHLTRGPPAGLVQVCFGISIGWMDGCTDARMIMILWSRTKRKVQESSAVITHYGWIAPARRLFDEKTTSVCLSWSSLSQTYLVIHIGMLPFSWVSHLHSTKINATVVSHKENA